MFDFPDEIIKLSWIFNPQWTGNTQYWLTPCTVLNKTISVGEKTKQQQQQQLVSWYFEPSQPQRMTSRLKTMFNLSPIYSARKSSNHKLSISHKISPDTNLHKKQQQQQKKHKHRTQNFRRISPFGITPVKKAHQARTRWYRGQFRRFINTTFKKKYKKGMGRSNKKYYINA